MGMIGRILVICKKELITTLRDARMRTLLVGPPLLQLIIFGYAVNLDVTNSRLGWIDLDQTPESRRLLAGFQGSHYFDIVKVLKSQEEIDRYLDRGELDAVIQVPVGFASDIRSSRTGKVQALLDGTNSNAAAIVSSYITQTVSQFTAKTFRQQAADRLVGATTQRGGPIYLPTGGVKADTRVWFNPNLESRDYFIPGVVVNIIALVTVTLTAMAVVREKEIGTLEQLMVTPITPTELMLGKTLPFALIGLIDLVFVAGAALLIFGIPFQGSPLLLLVSSILFLLTTLGAGLFISTVSGTQQQAMMGSFFYFLPTFMLSGFAIPIRNMPLPVQYLTYLNPIRYFIEISRGVFIKGIGLDILWPQLVGLFVIGTGMIMASALRFHKRID
jgi:ABC-2 type transport system permease protein